MTDGAQEIIMPAIVEQVDHRDHVDGCACYANFLTVNCVAHYPAEWQLVKIARLGVKTQLVLSKCYWQLRCSVREWSYDSP